MGNPVTVAGMAIMGLGLIVYFGIFDRLGPITTQKGMQRLSYVLFALGVVVMLTQSTPT